ncbi:MAG: hypothetical protein QXY49_03300 [Thermofilaceae archaeon]
MFTECLAMGSRGVSTVLGTLIFVLLASMLIALMLKIFYDYSSVLAEVATSRAERGFPALLEIQLRFAVSYEPAGLSVAERINGTVEGGGSYLRIVAENASGTYLAVVHLRVVGDCRLNCSLTLSSNVTGLVEIYENYSESSGVWTLSSKYFVKRSEEQFTVSLRSSELLIYAYAYKPMELSVSNPQVGVYGDWMTLAVRNTGYTPAEVHRVLLRDLCGGGEYMLDDKLTVLFPGEEKVYTLRLQPQEECVYEVRVVTENQVYTARFTP